VITKILFRRGDSDAWIDRNPVLESGEPGFDLEARVLKVGNGTSAWVDLPGVSIDGGLSSEVIAQAIESYLATHPLEGVTPQELEDAIAAVELLPGPKGDPGDASTIPGPSGKSAYELAQAGGYSGTQTQWLASLKGADGAASTVPGPKGDPGTASTVPGPKGDPGNSAYAVALANGFVGSQAQWLASLKGDPGENPTGAVTSTGITNIEVLTPEQYILITPQDGVLYILKEEE